VQPAAATLGFGSLVSAAKARQLACDGTITPVLIDEHGMPLNVGRNKRVVPPHLRKAVELRDESCVFAGCGAPKYWCDVHHVIHWLFGGETSLENLTSCQYTPSDAAVHTSAGWQQRRRAPTTRV
jgi:hypothetical protein